MRIFNNFFFKELIITEMSEISLNKFEKEKVVIRMYVEGRTIRQIAKEAHLAFRDISKIIKAYEKKVRLQQSNKEDNQSNQKIKKPSKSSLAFEIRENV
jgi:transposase